MKKMYRCKYLKKQLKKLNKFFNKMVITEQDK